MAIYPKMIRKNQVINTLIVNGTEMYDVNRSSNRIYHKHSGSSSSGGGCYGVPTYHVHTGNSTSGGGCYGKATTETYTYQVEVNDDPDRYCLDCGQSLNISTGTCWRCDYSGNMGNNNYGQTHWETRTGTRTVYSINCGKNESTVEYYSRNCGYEL